MEIPVQIYQSVSVVIPTRNRPDLVTRAVKSALEQTLVPEEVIVVIDGPDEATVQILRGMEDPRLRIVELPESRGPADARNVGIDTACGEWLAFLDDDDEWLSHKLETQIPIASSSLYALPIVTSRIVARTPQGEYVWPQRMPYPGEPLSEYLMVRNGLFLGETWIGTPTLLARTELMRKVPFTSGLQVHEDWDWLLRANAREGAGVEFVSEPLTICYIQQIRERASAGHTWRRSLAWIRENRDLVTPRAYAGFVATVISPAAARQGAWKAFLPLLRELFGFGKPRIKDLMIFAGMWLVPGAVRRRLRTWWKK